MNRPLLYEGKAKKVYAGDRDDQVILYYKDDATALNGGKKGCIEGKGEMNNRIAARLFGLLGEFGVRTHFIEVLSEREMLCWKTRIIPLEVIVRNVAAGSMAKRLGLEEGFALRNTVFELSYKDDALGDPLINEYHAAAIGASTFAEIREIFGCAGEVNRILRDFFLERQVRLIDFKVEFGRTVSGDLVLADEISPDTCRFWDALTGEKLDKDRFRRDLGGEKEAYLDILHRIA